MRSVFLFLIALCVALNLSAARPNILFLLADDMRADTIAAHGNPHIRTPHIDKLAATGFSFRQNYVFGGNSGAVCVPSRAMLMTGKTWFRIDAPTLKGEKLLPELLGENGYATFGTGKWHNGQESWLRAFQQGRTIMFGGMSDHTKVPVRDRGPDGRLTEERYAEKFSSELFADSAVDFLTKRDREKPFFAYVAFTAPHDPRQPPEKYREEYYRKRLPLPPNFSPQHPFDNGMMNSGRDENLGAWPRTESMIRDQLAEYYGLITHMDEQIGRIVDALRNSGAAENTIIIFAADNGLALGSHGLLGKQSVYEHSMRTPLIVSGPGIPKGQTRAFTYLHDLFPTICNLSGIASPSSLDGQDLRPLWIGEKQRLRDSVFLPFLNLQRAVRDERWKLIAYPKIEHLQLFDLANDPHELTNLIHRAEHASEVLRLRGLMAEWQKKVGDTVHVPATNRQPTSIDLTGKRREPDQWQPGWIVDKYFDDARRTEISVSGTRFYVDGKPFPYTGVSFFNAIFNPNFNASSDTRIAWVKKFQSYGINVFRIWGQWDNARGFADASPESTLYHPDGSLREKHLATLKSLLRDCADNGVVVELALFAKESWNEKIRLSAEAERKAVETLARELMPFRNVTFQIWNEHDNERVIPLVKLIKSIDPQRLVTNSPGYAGDLGSDDQNAPRTLRAKAKAGGTGRSQRPKSSH